MLTAVRGGLRDGRQRSPGPIIEVIRMRCSVNGRFAGSRCLALLFALGLITTLLASCASAPPPPVSTADEGDYDWEREGRIPPLGGDGLTRQTDRVDTFEEVAIEEAPLSVESVEPTEIMADSGYTADSTAIEMQGYRIQVFATGDRASAERVRGEAAAALQTAAYMALIDGLYKVQVGDCPTRLEAEQLLQRCRGLGYPDAWVTAATIRLPRAGP